MPSITIYTYSGDNRKLDKSTGFDLVSYATAGTFRAPCEVLRPVIDIDISGIHDHYETDLVVRYGNYAHIPQFGRYYYIIRRTLLNDKLVRLELQADVLMSWKTQIGGLTLYCNRSASDYDPFIADEFIHLSNKKGVTEFVPTESVGYTKTPLLTNWTNEANKHHITMCVVDRHHIEPPEKWNDDSYFPDYVSPYGISDDAHIITIKDYAMRYQSKIFVFKDREEMRDVTQTISAYYETRISFVKSIISFPFAIPYTAYQNNVYPVPHPIHDLHGLFLGDELLNYPNASDPHPEIYLDVSQYIHSEYIEVYRFSLDEATSFLDFEPYTNIEIYIPYYGWTKLPPQRVLDGSEVSVGYIVNFETGMAQCYVRRLSGAKSEILFTDEVMIGTHLALEVTNMQENERRREQNAMNTMISVITSLGATAYGAMSGNPIAITMGLTGVAGAIGNGIMTNAGIYDKALTNVKSDIHGAYSSQQVRIRMTRSVEVETQANIKDALGLPCRKMKK